jgi:hypothetical protein
MDSRDFLDLAKALVLTQNAGAAHFRAAVGRAYYAAFNFAAQTLDELGFPPAKNSLAHNQVVRMLQESGDEALQTAGGILGDLHGDRLKADYDLRRADIEKRKAAQAAVETAMAIFDDFNEFMNDTSRRSGVATNLKPQYNFITGKSSH